MSNLKPSDYEELMKFSNENSKKIETIKNLTNELSNLDNITDLEDILEIIKNKRKVVEQDKKVQPKLGCLMIMFDEPLWTDIIKKFVEESDLNTKLGGYEKEPHVTVVYGFNNDEIDLEKLKTYLIPLDKLSITSSKISIFENKDEKTKETYCVVKFELDSDELIKMNSDLISYYNITSDFPVYKPHVTIAYTDFHGRKYEQELDILVEFKPSKYVYSFDSKQIDILL